MSDNLAMMLANKRVRAYAEKSDEVGHRDVESMECGDCESFLNLGIEAFRWLQRAEETVLAADYEGLVPLTDEVREALDDLYAAWLVPCEFAERWIQSLQARGRSPGNLDRFRQACEEAEETLQRRDWQRRADAARSERLKSEPW